MLWIKRLILMVVLLPVATFQAYGKDYQAGVHYEILPQAVRTADPSKIEVNEIFSYTCGHCYTFEDTVEPWLKTLPADVDFQRTPAIWSPALEPYARAYYAALMLDVLHKVHTPIFEAIHLKKQRFSGEQDFAAVFTAAGVDGQKFTKAYNSFGMTSMVNQAKARVRSYRTQGTPEIIVNGKYRVSTRNTGGFSGMLSVAEFLIQQERAQLAQ